MSMVTLDFIIYDKTIHRNRANLTVFHVYSPNFWSTNVSVPTANFTQHDNTNLILLHDEWPTEHLLYV